MSISKKTVMISTIVALLFVGGGVVALTNAQRSDDTDRIVDNSPSRTDVGYGYADYMDIYYGHLGPVEGEQSESHSWIFRFQVKKSVGSSPQNMITVRQSYRTSEHPIAEGDYLISLGTPRGGDQLIQRVDAITPEEAEQIQTPADARRILGDNHALVYAN